MKNQISWDPIRCSATLHQIFCYFTFTLKIREILKGKGSLEEESPGWLPLQCSLSDSRVKEHFSLHRGLFYCLRDGISWYSDCYTWEVSQEILFSHFSMLQHPVAHCKMSSVLANYKYSSLCTLQDLNSSELNWGQDAVTMEHQLIC